ncbi:MAG: hypothetical protein ACXAC5_03960 [Promethearchaeota archaeon]|jgi:hypothetical protein
MLRFIGAVVVIVGLIATGLYFGGYWEGEASASVTDKGKQTFNDGISVVQDGVNEGLNSLKTEGKTTNE